MHGSQENAFLFNTFGSRSRADMAVSVQGNFTMSSLNVPLCQQCNDFNNVSNESHSRLVRRFFVFAVCFKNWHFTNCVHARAKQSKIFLSIKEV